MVHGESDGLPGLLVDVYGGTVVLQVLSAGMEARLETITASLQEVLTPDCILARNDSPIRELEGLPLEVRTLSGEPARVTIREHGLSYGVDPVTSQKTGLFLDQRDNRHAIRRYVKGRRVLDCFSNVGGFGMNAAVAGATGVTCVDLSSSSLRTAEENFRANSLEVGEVVEADAFDYLAAMRDEGARFGGIILDPPAFTKNKKTVATALKGYRRLNTLAMSILEENGILVTASCSHHVSREEFLAMVQSSAVRAGRTLRILEFRGAAADHPVLPAMAETEYLKLAICSVT